MWLLSLCACASDLGRTSSAIVAVAIVVLGFALKGGIDNFSNRDRVVTVRGLCEKGVKFCKEIVPHPILC